MSTNRPEILSFEVTRGEKSGDLLSNRRGDKKLKVGLLTCAYFEYWRMYQGLQEQVRGDLQTIADRIGARFDVVYPGMVDTLDLADQAGRLFKQEAIDILVISEGTYCTDYIVHQCLLHLPPNLPLCLFASQVHTRLNFSATYDQSLRNSGPMGIVQLAAGFRKMGAYPRFTAVVGGNDEEAAYTEIFRFIDVWTTILNLKHWNIALIGHVFRGMYDFQFDKTAVTGKLGPHIIDLDIKHLIGLLEEIPPHDERVAELTKKVGAQYAVVGLRDSDIVSSARLAIAFQDLVRRYKLDGLVLLGQHFIEQQANSTCYLGLSELLAADQALAVTEGDVLGLIMSKVLKDFSGKTPFFGEWEEIDLSLNAVMLLGHGFIDPRMARKDRPIQVQPACENWGFEGNSMGFEATYAPGPVTLTHCIQDQKGWRILVSEGEILDTPPLQISECSLVVRVEQDVRRYFRQIIEYGFPHHVIAAPGRLSGHLEYFARQLDLEICRI
jgi:L-arabinose isomerase